MAGTDHGSALVAQGLEHLAQGITIFDGDLRLVAWNRRFLDLYDYPARLAFPGADFASFIDHNARRGDYGPGDIEAQVAERVRLARAFLPHRFRRRRHNGAVIEIVGNPLPAGGFVATYTDVSDEVAQRQTLMDQVAAQTRALSLAEERLGLIANEVPVGIAHIDRDKMFLYVNTRFARAYQRTPAEVIGHNISAVLHADTLAASARFFEQARRGAVVDFEMRITLPDGRTKDIRTLLRPERPSSGEVIGFYLVSIDVSRGRATQAALMRSQKMDALGRLASGISHDFNNVLTVILGNLMPLADELGDRALVEDFVTPAIGAARRGSALTRRLLALARRELLDPQATDIAEAVEEICTLLRATLPDTLDLRRSYGRDLPAVLVDRGQLEMALLNLAINARDATGGRGTLAIDVALHTLSPEDAGAFHARAGDYIRIRVSDDGCGMSAAMVEKAFEPFVTSKPDGAGTGLGLAMVYGFVRQSNGAITLDSEPGAGATFTILLPLAGEDAPAIAAPPPPDPDPAPAPGPGPDPAAGPGGDLPLVLLVDDELQTRRTVRRKLATLGHPIIEARNAAEALRLLERVEGIATMISDINMPGDMDGIALARHAGARWPDLRIVLISGQAVLPQGRDALDGVALLRKPFGTGQLRDVLANAKGAP